MSPAPPALIGIDWGSSRLRAFQFGADGQVQKTATSERGVATIGDGSFDQVLTSVLEGWAKGLPLLMCGMVGSRQGWLEVPYSACPVRLDELAHSIGSVDTTAGEAWILGGVSTTTEGAAPATQDRPLLFDVMRGEETQIAGVTPHTGAVLIVTPGTHSKWTWVQDATVQNFRTYMTGELYAVLRGHSILGRLMEPNSRPCADAAFREGIYTAFEDPELLHCLFNVRTQALFERKAPRTLASYLSGMLIGSEVAAALPHHPARSAIVIASPELGPLYRLAMSEAGMHDVTVIDGNDAVARGLWKLWQLRR